MNIALVILHAEPARGGAERYTIDLAAALLVRGHAVSFLAATFAETLPDGVQCVTLDSRGITRLGQYERFLDALDEHLRLNRYDIVHAMLPVRGCDVYHPHAGIAAEAMAAGHLKHDSPLGRGAARILNRMNRKRRRFAEVEREMISSPKPPLIICLSDYIRRNLLAHYQLPETRLATIVNGADLARFDPAARPAAGIELRRRFNLSETDVVALIIAQDFQRKGLPQAIEALSCIGDPHLRLLVVGKESAAPYRRLAGRLGVGDRVIFAGSTSDPYPFYRAADFFVLPTRHDPCSLVVLEALAMGLPVISTAMNGACEVMEDGRHGFILPDAADVARLTEAMRAMLDSAARSRMREACVELCPTLAAERHIDAILASYTRVTAFPV